MIKTEKGLTITLYHDVSTYRPYDLVMRVQGTEGIYSSAHNGIYLNGLSPEKEEWDDFEKAEYVKKNDPLLWAEQRKNASGAGHGGGDYLELYRLINAVRDGKEPDIDVYDAASWCVVTELSGRSVRLGSQPVQFPDFTKGAWAYRSPKDSIFTQ